MLETQLPESVDFVSSTPAALSSADGLVRIGSPDVADAANTVATVVVRPAVAGSGGASAQVYAAQGDPVLSNNQTEVLLSAAFVAPPVSDLTVTQTPPAAPRAGLPATWTVTVTNNGPDAADQVSLSDVLPAGAPFVGAAPSPSSLENGRVSAASSSRDANGAESVSTVSVLATPSTTANTRVAITASASSALLGTAVNFTVTARNKGPDAASGVKTLVQLPAVFTFSVPA